MSQTEVRAAGGVVLRAATAADENDGLHVLVVHRPAYDDWSLPKGKLDPGEDDAIAAQREVHEETGVQASITRDAGSIQYIDRRGRPKTVRYFVMSVAHDPGTRPPDDEVDIVEWWPLDRARAALTYPRDRELLATIEPGA